MRKYKIKRKNNYKVLFMTIVIYILFSSIGYSYLSTTMGLNGNITVKGLVLQN